MSLENKPRTHKDNMSVLCGVCYKGGDLRDITDLQLKQLRNLMESSYNLIEMKFQRVLCRGCTVALTAHNNNPYNPGRKLLKSRITVMTF